jgi:hypothetical protein
MVADENNVLKTIQTYICTSPCVKNKWYLGYFKTLDIMFFWPYIKIAFGDILYKITMLLGS